LRGYDPEAVDQFFDALVSEAAAAGLRVLPDVPVCPRWQSGAAGRQAARHCHAAWRGVADPPGVRLRRAQRKILGSSGEVLLTRRRRELTLANGQVLRIDRRGSKIDVTVGAGHPILWILGNHKDAMARGMVLLPGQRCFVFPVEGTKWRNAVMTAVDESGATALWFRRTERRVYEIVVSPQVDITTELLCMMELTARWLSTYYESSAA
jgi:hypothetical protein